MINFQTNQLFDIPKSLLTFHKFSKFGVFEWIMWPGFKEVYHGVFIFDHGSAFSEYVISYFTRPPFRDTWKIYIFVLRFTFAYNLVLMLSHIYCCQKKNIVLLPKWILKSGCEIYSQTYLRNTLLLAVS